jgi:hypothetical protein
VDDLLARTQRFLKDVADDYVKRPVDKLLRWVLSRALVYLLAAAILATSVVFLLVGGVEALRRAQVEPWIAYLGVGAVGLLAGLAVIRIGKPPRER